jgi:hypothetical protein
MGRAWLSRAVQPGSGAIYELVGVVGAVAAARRLWAGLAPGRAVQLAGELAGAGRRTGRLRIWPGRVASVPGW